MKTKKAGTVLVNIKDKKVYLIYRKKLNDYSFPKGHLENNESLEECAIRETEEETGRKCHIIFKIGDIEYVTSDNEDCICTYYLAIDDGKTTKTILDTDKEEYILLDYQDVLNKLTYNNNKLIWNKVKDYIYKLFNSIYTYNLSTINGFLVKPFNFNHLTQTKEEMNKNLEELKLIYNIPKVARVGQVHSDIIKEVNSENYDLYQEADALITAEKGIGLLIRTADCQAIMIYDNVNKVIANVHSGWRGTLKRIINKTVDLMMDKYNSNPFDLEVVICPSILQDHFEVDEDVYILFKNEFEHIEEYTIAKNNKYYIDTVSLNRDLMLEKGIKNITVSDMCTVCNGEHLHSYRYDKEKSGRNLAIIVME